jgi:small subunit ribosomal protein S6
VIDSTLKADDIRNLREKVVNFISNHGGKIVKVDEWGKRRLAYEINKKQYGYYINIRFTAPDAVPELLEREYRLNESVLRHLTIKVDRRVLKQESEQERQKARMAAALEGEEEEWDILPDEASEENLEEQPGATK